MELKIITSKRESRRGSKPCDGKCGRIVSATKRFCLECWTEVAARVDKLIAEQAAEMAAEQATAELQA